MDYTTIIISILVGAVCGVFTQRIMMPKGYGERASFCVGLFLSLIGVIIACVVPPKEGYEPKVTSESDKADALSRYKKLLDEGTITQAEFDAKKRELLG